jgi:hypothetical protein
MYGRKLKRPRNRLGFTLDGFVVRVREVANEHGSLIVGWRPEWTGICEDFWKFDLSPEEALEAIEEREHLKED